MNWIKRNNDYTRLLTPGPISACPRSFCYKTMYTHSQTCRDCFYAMILCLIIPDLDPLCRPRVLFSASQKYISSNEKIALKPLEEAPD